jgi:hypothetical protein
MALILVQPGILTFQELFQRSECSSAYSWGTYEYAPLVWISSGDRYFCVQETTQNCLNDFLALLGNNATWQTCADMAGQLLQLFGIERKVWQFFGFLWFWRMRAQST